MKALLVQPPFAQLNAPYPAIHYLAAFLRGRGIACRAVDHSIELYRSVFSRRGLVPAFAAAREALASGLAPDEATESQLERYLSYEDLYLEWIDGLVAFLAGGDPAFAHRLTRASELPRGMRAEAFLDARGGQPDATEARSLATAILEDLGDLLSFALDPGFSTVRYGERIAASASSFSTVREALDASPLLDSAYAPLLDAEWRKEGAAPGLLLITVPFPGCLLGALACARSARAAFGAEAPRIVLGGGYVSTELRGLRDPGIFDFCDYLSFDSGFGSLASILEVEGGAGQERLFRTMLRGANGRVVAAGFPAEDEAASEPELRRITHCDQAERLGREDVEALASTAPDYSDVDFGRYLRVADSENPMHRLWSDSPWLKYRLAHGCYWHRCAFCDTELDYVSGYAPARLEPLLAAATAAAERTGLYGIHFVDEAMPMGALLALARANRARARDGARPFHFWGNVRFDSSWTEDRCEYLAASGLVAVSGGIEIATEGGLEMTDKGFDLAGLVGTLVAMKRAGLLVHAYLIYGFPGQEGSDIVDSAEVCRQLFAAGLVDSAFWHRFVLTRHSRLRADHLAGRGLRLEPLERPWDFANNDLGFSGEERYDEFDGPLSATLEAWMSGRGLERGARPSLEEAGLPTIRGGRGRSASPRETLVEELADAADAGLEAARAGLGDSGRAHWIAGLPLARVDGSGSARLAWAYRGEARELVLPPGRPADGVVRVLTALARDPEGRPFAELTTELEREIGRKLLVELRSSGLVIT